MPEGPDRDQHLLHLRLSLGDAFFKVGQFDDGVNTLVKAAEIAGELGDADGLVQAALGVAETNYIRGVSEERSADLLRRALEQLGGADSIERCRLMSKLGSVLYLRGDMELASRINSDAVAIARRVGDTRAIIDALGFEGGHLSLNLAQAPERASERLEVLDEVLTLAEKLGDSNTLMKALGWHTFGYIEVGDTVGFEKALDRLHELSETHQTPFWTWFSGSFNTLRAILRGDFDLGERLAEDALEQSQTLQGVDGHGLYGIQMFTIRREQGRLAQVAPIMKRLLEDKPDDSVWRPGFAIIASDLGFEEQARKLFHEIARSGFTHSSRSSRACPSAPPGR